MQINSIVEVIEDFEHLRQEWGFNYPKKGDLLTVRDIQPHPKQKNGFLLWFEELDLWFGISLFHYRGGKKIYHFIELQKPGEVSMSELINNGEHKGRGRKSDPRHSEWPV